MHFEGSIFHISISFILTAHQKSRTKQCKSFVGPDGKFRKAVSSAASSSAVYPRTEMPNRLNISAGSQLREDKLVVIVFFEVFEALCLSSSLAVAEAKDVPEHFPALFLTTAKQPPHTCSSCSAFSLSCWDPQELAETGKEQESKQDQLISHSSVLFYSLFFWVELYWRTKKWQSGGRWREKARMFFLKNRDPDVLVQIDMNFLLSAFEIR